MPSGNMCQIDFFSFICPFEDVFFYLFFSRSLFSDKLLTTRLLLNSFPLSQVCVTPSVCLVSFFELLWHNRPNSCAAIYCLSIIRAWRREVEIKHLDLTERWQITNNAFLPPHPDVYTITRLSVLATFSSFLFSSVARRVTFTVFFCTWSQCLYLLCCCRTAHKPLCVCVCVSCRLTAVFPPAIVSFSDFQKVSKPSLGAWIKKPLPLFPP